MRAAEKDNDRRPKERRRRHMAVGLIAALLVFVTIAVLVGTNALGGLDVRASQWLQAHQIDQVREAAVRMDRVGRWWVLGMATAAIALALAFVAHRSRDAAYLIATMAASVILNFGFKAVFQRLPPGGSSGDGGTTHPSLYAFPSGHTMSAAAIAAALALIAWPTRWRWPVLVAGAASAGLMGLSRMYLNVHWATDVAAGLALGAAVALGVRLLLPVGWESAARPRRRRASPVTGPIDVVFLDWGDTIMTDFPGQTEPMATWARVAPVEGAPEVLGRLREHYRLIVATNSDDSGEAAVLAALGRAGLGGLIQGVVSSRDIGARKPDPFFYRAALLRAGHAGLPLAPARAVMVGDSWPNDVAGARSAGLRAVWFNAQGADAPPGPVVADGEIRSLDQLPAALDRLGGPLR